MSSRSIAKSSNFLSDSSTALTISALVTGISSFVFSLVFGIFQIAVVGTLQCFFLMGLALVSRGNPFEYENNVISPDLVSLELAIQDRIPSDVPLYEIPLEKRDSLEESMRLLWESSTRSSDRIDLDHSLIIFQLQKTFVHRAASLSIKLNKAKSLKAIQSVERKYLLVISDFEYANRYFAKQWNPSTLLSEDEDRWT